MVREPNGARIKPVSPGPQRDTEFVHGRHSPAHLAVVAWYQLYQEDLWLPQDVPAGSPSSS
jgi:hypothetical protein